jgi:hypothetical protein
MGLDNFVSRSPGEAVLTPEDERAIAESGVSLCRGMQSDGVTSFRGKVYAQFVSAVTGESLYEEWLAPRTVAEMADKLAGCDPESAEQGLDLYPDFIPSPGEIRDLQKLFRICADRGLGLIAWS